MTNNLFYDDVFLSQLVTIYMNCNKSAKTNINVIFGISYRTIKNINE